MNEVNSDSEVSSDSEVYCDSEVIAIVKLTCLKAKIYKNYSLAIMCSCARLSSR